MAWVRIHDGVMTNAKVASLSDAGFRLWVMGLCYCQTALTDGLIPKDALRQMSARPSTIRELTTSKLPGRAPLWEVHDLGFMVHDYAEWNENRADVLNRRERGKQRVEKFRTERARNALQVDVERRLKPIIPPRQMSGSGSSSYVPGTHDQAPPRENALQDTRVELEPAEAVRWFDRVYVAYPNKDRKQAASQAWSDLRPDLVTAQAILTDIDQRKQAGWVRLERRFIPHLVRFLQERQWEDTPEPGPVYEDIDDGIPHAWRCGKCGDIHEGTADQSRRGVCLKSVSA